ncbi:LLM class flavin-dependent oxidoreductase, partial [Mycoplasmopsis canis]
VYPRAIDLPIWVATGGNIHSTINIALKGLPIVYAVIGGNPYAFKPLVNAYKQVGKEAGHSEDKLKVGAHSWGYIAETTEKAKNDFFWPTKQLVDNIARTRESWTEMDRRSYEYMVSDQGAMIVGDPKLVAKKIIKLVEELQLDRFMLHLPTGSVPHEDLLKAIKLYGEEVAPIVREYFANK